MLLMLEPIAPETYFLRRIMRRYSLDFVIMHGGILVEERETPRDATGPELQMWRRLIPSDIQEKVDNVYSGADLSMEATTEEIHETVAGRAFVYLNYKDFEVLCRCPPKEFKSIDDYSAMAGSTHVCISEKIPHGYYLSLEKSDNRLVSSGGEIGQYEYRLEPIVAPW